MNSTFRSHEMDLSRWDISLILVEIVMVMLTFGLTYDEVGRPHYDGPQLDDSIASKVDVYTNKSNGEW